MLITSLSLPPLNRRPRTGLDLASWPGLTRRSAPSGATPACSSGTSPATPSTPSAGWTRSPWRRAAASASGRATPASATWATAREASSGGSGRGSRWVASALPSVSGPRSASSLSPLRDPLCSSPSLCGHVLLLLMASFFFLIFFVCLSSPWVCFFCQFLLSL